ncbi:MAG: hypothetical protein HRU01_16650 [Myxococcales bacterium]|nr:hypothetical protein [Myxococcales bacterium]
MGALGQMRWRRGLALVFVAVVSLGIGPCDKFGFGSRALQFRAPLFRLVAEPGDLDFELRVSALADPDTLSITLDGTPVDPAELTWVGRRRLVGSLSVSEPGFHFLRASVSIRFFFFAYELEAWSGFEIAEFENPDECEILNQAQCLLPFPSQRFLEDVGSESDTGYRMAIPAAGMPVLNGDPWLPDPLNDFDGFSPTAQLVMHFDGAVDLEASGAAVLLAPRCCGQIDATPYEDVRTLSPRSLERDSPTVLIDAETGQRILHFVEMDARASDDARRVLFLRPGVALEPGRRYIAAVRNLKDANGARIPAEPAFRALRDRLPTTVPAIDERRDEFEDIFGRLTRARVYRWELQLAFQFTVRSQDQLTHDMLALRDAGLEQLEGNPLSVVFRPADIAFNANPANNNPNCQTDGDWLWKRVRGSFRAPFYMAPFLPFLAGYAGLQTLSWDADRLPVQTGTHLVPFDVVIPCSVLDPSKTTRPLLVGHGLFQTGHEIMDAISDVAEQSAAQGTGSIDYIGAATDWRGLSGKDLGFLALVVIGVGDHRLNNFPSFVDRLKQGMLDTLLLARVLKTARFNEVEAFQVVPGDPSTGVFPGPSEEELYYGVSLGGIMGLFLGALTPDITNMNIDVGAMNFSLLIQRSTQFIPFETLLNIVGVDDSLDLALGLGLLHEQWVTSEPAAYIRHITGTVADPLPGASPKNVLMTVAWLDKQVSNQASEIAARSLGIPNVEGSLVRDLIGIEDVAEGATSGLVVYDAGSFDVFDPAYDAVIPRLANLVPSTVCDPHARRVTIPASIEQMLAFLQPGGRIWNACDDDGVCDASEAFERPGGVEAVCDPL